MATNPTVGGVNQQAEKVYASGGSKPVAGVSTINTGAAIANAIGPVIGNAVTSFIDNKKKRDFGKGLVNLESMLLANQDKGNIERRRLVHQSIKDMDVSDSIKGQLTQQVKAQKYTSKSLVGGGSVQLDDRNQVVSQIDPEPYKSVSWTMGHTKKIMEETALVSPAATEAFKTAFSPPLGSKPSAEDEHSRIVMSKTFSEALTDMYRDLDKHSSSLMGTTPMRNIDDVNAYNSKNINAVAGNVEALSALLRSPQFTNKIIDDKKALNLQSQLMNAAKIDYLKRLSADPDAVDQLGGAGVQAKVAAMFDAEITSLKEFGEGVLKNSSQGIDLQYSQMFQKGLDIEKAISDGLALKEISASNPLLAQRLQEDRIGVTEYYFKLTKTLQGSGYVGEAQDAVRDWLDPAMKIRAEGNIKLLEDMKKGTRPLTHATKILEQLTANPAVFRYQETTQGVVDAVESLLKQTENNTDKTAYKKLRIYFNRWKNEAEDVWKFGKTKGLSN